MAKARFDLYQDVDGQWRWRLYAANNRIIATGESHTRERDARRAAAKVCDTCRMIHFDNA